jgi:hypothetical protein
MGKKNCPGQNTDGETQAHNISGGQKQNRSRTAGSVGEGESSGEEGGLEPAETDASMGQTVHA